MPDSVPDVIISQVGFGDLIVFFFYLVIQTIK